MTRSSTPTLHCDGEEGECTAWSVDHWEVTASTVNGVRITDSQRAPGWSTTASADFCPEHAVARETRA